MDSVRTSMTDGSRVRLAMLIRRRNVIRAGFAIVIALLVFSTIEAYRIQDSLSAETLEIYHRHVRQDDLLWRLRRTLWLGANASRDFLLNPHSDRNERFAAQLAEFRTTYKELLKELGGTPGMSGPPANLQARIEDFWGTLEGLPEATARLSAADRYELVQREITPRRMAVGDLVREFAELGQESLRTSEAALAQSRREATSRLLWVLGLCMFIALLVVGLSLKHSESLERQTAQQYEEVERARVELQQFATRLIQIQEEERTRLSRELHDELGQSLATMRLEVSRAESQAGQSMPEVRERLARAGALAQSMVQTVRDISALLRPSLLDDLGLEPALEWQVEDFTRRTGVRCELRQEGLGGALPDEVRTCVYRVIQESLHNCEKYASASRVTIHIVQAGPLLSVAVQDDGKGFDPDSETKGSRAGKFGILGMRERAAALGGTLEIDSAPGRGACITLRLPLDPAGAETVPPELEVRA